MASGDRSQTATQTNETRPGGKLCRHIWARVETEGRISEHVKSLRIDEFERIKRSYEFIYTENILKIA